MVVVAAPADAEELYRIYGGYVVHLVRKMGIPAQEAEDVAADIMARLLERNVIGMFDPQYSIEHRGEKVQANFRTFLSHHVSLYVRGKRDALNRKAIREPLLCDQLAEGGQPWVELFGGSAWDDYSRLDAEQFVARMRAYLASLPPRSARDRCDLLVLFDVLVAQVQAEGRVSVAELEKQFGISSSTSYAWIGKLREVLVKAPATLPPPPPLITWQVGGVVLTAADLLSAAAILKSPAGGIMVRQPLAKAGHPLAKAGKNWYHPFAAEERTRFPELEIDPQTHVKPAGHVRLAVVHRLERMLAEAESPAPVPLVVLPEPDPPTTEDLLEAELWKLGADAAAVDKIKDLAWQLTAP